VLAASVLLAARAPAAAQDARPQVKVMAKLPLAGISVRRMSTYSAKRKRYLYLMQAGEQDYRVADVSKPQRPALVDHSTIPAPGVVENVRRVTEDLGIAGVSVSGPSSPEPSEAGTMRILDLSDPERPRTLLTVRNVTSEYTDTRRRLIYLANPEGLTIVRYWPAPKSMPLCTSSDAMNPNADCQ
jgi:hypothetical protein